MLNIFSELNKELSEELQSELKSGNANEAFSISNQGTGLGLSLSHDILKAHGGGVKVETKEGEGLSLSC